MSVQLLSRVMTLKLASVLLLTLAFEQSVAQIVCPDGTRVSNLLCCDFLPVRITIIDVVVA